MPEKSQGLVTSPGRPGFPAGLGASSTTMPTQSNFGQRFSLSFEYKCQACHVSGAVNPARHTESEPAYGRRLRLFPETSRVA